MPQTVYPLKLEDLEGKLPYWPFVVYNPTEKKITTYSTNLDGIARSLAETRVFSEGAIGIDFWPTFNPIVVKLDDPEAKGHYSLKPLNENDVERLVGKVLVEEAKVTSLIIRELRAKLI